MKNNNFYENQANYYIDTLINRYGHRIDDDDVENDMCEIMREIRDELTHHIYQKIESRNDIRLK